MESKNEASQVRPVLESQRPVELIKIVPKGSIRVVFWGLRVYILLMVVLVVIGFARGMH